GASRRTRGVPTPHPRLPHRRQRRGALLAGHPASRKAPPRLGRAVVPFTRSLRPPMRTGTGEAMLEVRGLRKSDGDNLALDGLDLSVAAGEIVGLLGPNGAGKTTLVSIVGGLLRADSGSVVIDGIDVSTKPHAARASLGVAPQDTGVYPSLRCRDQLRYFA